MSTLYLIRHGQASFGQDNYDKLSDLGKEQSRLLAHHLVKSGFRFDRLYCGMMVRHRETATEYVEYSKKEGTAIPEVEFIPGFNEYDPAEVIQALLPILIREQPEYQRHLDKIFSDQRSFNLLFEAITRMWCSGNYDDTGITPWSRFAARVNAAISAIIEGSGSDKSIAVFTSGGPISAAVQRALGLSAETALGIGQQLVNTAISRFKFTQKRFTMATFNEYQHLEHRDRSDIVTYR
jgi:broad specificity phosphatase PhoE